MTWQLVALVLGTQAFALAGVLGWRWTAVSRAEAALEAHRIKLNEIDVGVGITAKELAAKIVAIETFMKIRRVG